MTDDAEIDLNLMLALGALLEDRNLTRAGERIGMSQPAMSAALVRLRRHFGDDLLEREGRGYRRTVFGWLSVPFVLTGTGMVAIVPERMARLAIRSLRLAIFEPPFGRVELVEAAYWHPSRSDDPAVRWLLLIVVPLVAGERVLGALILGRLAARLGFTESDLGMAASFAGHTAVAMELARARADQILLAQAEDHDRIAGDLHDRVIGERSPSA